MIAPDAIRFAVIAPDAIMFVVIDPAAGKVNSRLLYGEYLPEIKRILIFVVGAAE